MTSVGLAMSIATGQTSNTHSQRKKAMKLTVLAAAMCACGSAIALDCATLKREIEPKMNAVHSAALQVVKKEDVGNARILGTCAGGSMRIILPHRSALAKAPNGPPPGFHAMAEAIGPETMVPPTKWAVSSPTPGCDGIVSADDVLSAAGTLFRVVPGGKEVLDYMNRTGWGVSRHQNFAECRAICAVVPKNVLISDEIIAVFWNPQGPHVIGALGKEAEGRWGPGPGYFRVDQGYSARTVGENQLVCKLARNWSHTHSRLFQLRIKYKAPGG